MIGRHPAPTLVEIAIEPKSKADQQKLGAVLAKLAAEDPSFRFSTDAESGQTIIKGTDELHLDTKIDILKRTYKVEANIGTPQVAYLERISRPVTVEYTHKRRLGPKGEFASVKIVAEPLPPGSGFEFVNGIVGGAVPKEYIPGVEKGLDSVLSSGVLAGFPVVDLKVSLVDGKYHDVDSSELAFEIAARMALREALQMGGATLFEPIMKVEVLAPQDCAAWVIRDLGSRHAHMQEQTQQDDMVAVSALAPLAAMLGYHNTVPAIGQGRVTFTMQFHHYAPVSLPDEPPPFRPAIGMRA
ncbi:Translation elongation factor G [Rhodoplanes sp. Z2-YC6860]|nr:Translation elongation factor G [Rhodoplanes sp. Z2-YC6860]